LRRDTQTVDSLARELGLSDNAVRLHLAALEREGLVRVVSVRREGPGKPANIYGMADDADLVLSQAHAPLLRALLDELRERVSVRELTTILRATGKRAAGRTTHPHGSLAARAEVAVGQLNELGAQVRVETRGGQVSIESDGCIIGSVVTHHPQACAAIASMVGAMAGADAAVACDRSGPPRCSFRLSD
jgi:predicted ArsR family transcriptional regulator